MQGVLGQLPYVRRFADLMHILRQKVRLPLLLPRELYRKLYT